MIVDSVALVGGKLPQDIFALTALTALDLSWVGVTGPIPAEIGKLTALEYLRVPPASPNARRGARPPLSLRRTLSGGTAAGGTGLPGGKPNQFTGPIPTVIGQLTKLKYLRVLPASPTPGAARDRPSTS